jgi:dolichol phosphate-mannose biosynthesis regulatory protein
MLLVAAVVFAYYTTWALILVRGHLPSLARLSSHRNVPVSQPLLDTSSPLHSFFPPREWAIRIPAFILIVGLSVVGIFVGFTILKEKKRKAEKAKMRTA